MEEKIKKDVFIIDDDELEIRLLKLIIGELGGRVCGVLHDFPDDCFFDELTSPTFFIINTVFATNQTFAGRLKSAKLRYSFSVLLVSGFPVNATATLIKATNADGYILKPFNKEQIKLMFELCAVNLEKEMQFKLRNNIICEASKIFPCGFVLIDNKKFINCDYQFARTLEIPQSEIEGKYISDLQLNLYLISGNYNDERQGEVVTFDELFSQGEFTGSVLCKYVTVSGNEKFLEIIFKQMPGDVESTKIFCIIDDISIRKTIIEKFNLSKKTPLVSDAGFAFWKFIIHDKSDISLVPIFTENFGLHRMIKNGDQTQILKQIYVADIPVMEKKFNLLASGGQQKVDFMIRMLMPNGLYKTLQIIAKSEINQLSPNEIELSGVTLDLDKYMADNELMLAGSENVKTMLNIIPLGICIIQSGYCLWANAAFNELLGIENGESVNKFVMPETISKIVSSKRKFTGDINIEGGKILTVMTSQFTYFGKEMSLLVASDFSRIKEIKKVIMAHYEKEQLSRIIRHETEMQLFNRMYETAIKLLIYDFADRLGRRMNGIRLCLRGISAWNESTNVPLPNVVGEFLKYIGDEAVMIESILTNVAGDNYNQQDVAKVKTDINVQIKNIVNLKRLEISRYKIKLNEKYLSGSNDVLIDKNYFCLLFYSIFLHSVDFLKKSKITDKYIEIKTRDVADKICLELSNNVSDSSFYQAFVPSAGEIIFENLRHLEDIDLLIVKLLAQKMHIKISAEKLPLRGAKILIEFGRYW